jgi:hypothetical protein
MRKLFIFLNLVGLIFSVNQTSATAWTKGDIPVAVVEVRDLGLSDRDESKSVIEVRWTATPIQKELIVWFNLTLSITYADGTTISKKQTIEKEALSAQIEVPSVKTFGGRPPAFIKKIDARVCAVIYKNQ